MDKIIIIHGSSFYEVSSDGTIFSKQKQKFLPIHSNGKGYMAVNLWDGKKQSRHYVHRLVASCFLDNKHNFPDVNHKNGIKSDNFVDNLEWCSRKDNLVHAHKNNLFKKYKINMESNHGSWVGKSINKREVISVLSEQKNGNYKVEVKCECGNILTMYYNDFLKGKHQKCRKCN